MIQSMGAEQRGIDRKFELTIVAVHHQGSPAGSCRQGRGWHNWPTGHFVIALRSLPPWLLVLTCLHGSSPSSALDPGVTALPNLSPLSWSLSPGALALPESALAGKSMPFLWCLSVAHLHCSCCSLAHFSVQFHPQSAAGYGTSDLAAADCGDKEVGPINSVPTDASAQRLLDLKSSGS